MDTFLNLKDKAIESFLALSLKKKLLFVAIFIITLVVIVRPFLGNKVAEESPEQLRGVRTELVSELSAVSSPLSILGTVTSRSEATIRAESPGELTAVYKRIGDFVPAGTIIAEIENSAQRALVTQAEGAYEAVRAGKNIAGINLGSAGTSLGEAKAGALNTISNAYSAMDDAVRAKTDVMWDNPRERDPRFIVTVADDKLILKLKIERTSIETALRAREEKNGRLSQEDDLVTELTAVEGELRDVKTYLDDLALALSRAVPDSRSPQTALDGWKTIVGLTRTGIGGMLSSVSGSRSALSGAVAGVSIADKNAGAGGGSASDAQLKSALGNLEAARAQLEKTIMRSPISGTINSLSIKQGDIISPYSEVAVVSNNGALEIIAYVTEENKRQFAVGARATIEGGASGMVTRIAPALDPKTKKIEVRVGITEGAALLVNGQSVAIGIERVKQAIQGGSGVAVSIPLSAIKLTPAGAFTFTVKEDGTLSSLPVTTGTLSGEKIAVTSGLTPDTKIVVDARGLKDGMKVMVTNK